MRTLNLALQGGGSHGAFTWGVLDALLADNRIALEGLSGTSAGAVNAVALASGYAKALASGDDPRIAARASLARLWAEIAAGGRLGAFHDQLGSILWSGMPAEFAPANIFRNALQGLFSPYQTNPLDINPLRDLLERQIDFQAIAASGLKVFVSATQVTTGKSVVFTGAELTAQAVAASACLPMLFQAVEIAGECYWDGGYSANPALAPLVDACHSRDLMLVQINALRRDHTPRSPQQILDRISELTFNASLLTEIRAINLMNRLLEEGALDSRRCSPVLLHRIDGGLAMQEFAASTRNSTDAMLIRGWFEIGQASATRWLATHFDSIGQRTTVDIQGDYLNPSPVPQAGQVVSRSQNSFWDRLKGLWRQLSRVAARRHGSS